MDGVLLINKSAGMTSFDVVREVRKIFNEKRVGHTGTLDPQAEGLMIILIGKYTKFLPFCVHDNKTYQATFKLGILTDTQDIWGTVVDQKEPKQHSQEELDEIAKNMLGKQLQIPPKYSAIKKDGKKLYEYARKGEEVEVEPREIEVYELNVKEIGNNEYSMDACVSSGTYIRTLIQDYAEKMDEYGTMTSLKRIAIENITINDAIALNDLNEGSIIIDPTKIISKEWELVDGSNYYDDIIHGRIFKADKLPKQIIFGQNDIILAAYELRSDGYYHCVRGLL